MCRRLFILNKIRGKLKISDLTIARNAPSVSHQFSVNDSLLFIKALDEIITSYSEYIFSLFIMFGTGNIMIKIDILKLVSIVTKQHNICDRIRVISFVKKGEYLCAHTHTHYLLLSKVCY